jgi:ABC-2 type transport system permease protein
LDGVLALALFLFPTLTDPDGNPLVDENPLQMSSEMFVGLAAVALAIGVIVAMQDAIIEEVQLGTAAWVLSKPVTRTALLAAKLAAAVLGFVLLMALPPVVGAYGLFWLYEPGAVTWPQLAGMLGVISLHALFYLTLALLLGTLTTRRGALLAVTLGSLLVGGMVPITALVQISPWQLQRVGMMVLHGMPLDNLALTMIGATAAWCVLFLGAAAWRIERMEF